MNAQNTRHDTGRATRGGTVARVLLIILGVFLAFTGFIFALACIALILESDEAGFFVLPFSLISLIGGIALIVLQVRGSKRDKGTPEPASGRETVVSAQTLTPEQPGVPTPVDTKSEASHSSAADDIASLVFRSDDVFASLKDLVRHDSATVSAGNQRHLASMLAVSGLMEWDDAPVCRGGRLSRNERFWISTSTDQLTERQYDTLCCVEAALEANQAMTSVEELRVNDPNVEVEASAYLRSVMNQKPSTGVLTNEGLRLAYPDTDAAQTTGEWIVRSTVCSAMEDVRTPFRGDHNIHCNMAEGLVVLSIEIPRPNCFSIFTDSPSRRGALARAYALRLSVLFAKYAFQASPQVERVVVNCHKRGSDETLLSIDISKKLLATLERVASGTQIEDGFPTDSAIHVRFADGWFAPVEPFVSFDDPSAQPPSAALFPELDERVASPVLERCCGATHVRDLGINEHAGRMWAWRALQPQLEGTTEQAVSALVAARDKAADITVAEACTRAIQALVEGKIELDDRDDLGELFIYGSALDRAYQRAHKLVDADESGFDPEGAITILTAALEPIDSMGAYLNDADTVFRYFNSVPERIRYNLDNRGDTRSVRLVPDSYFNAHSDLSMAYTALEQHDKALEHAEVCLRLAPYTVNAVLRKVRVLEHQQRTFEAADQLIEVLRIVTTPHDAAICLYRLAYMEWKLGREELSVACYQRALTWNTEVSDQARKELDDLLASLPTLSRLTGEQADALLAREGIPLGCVRTDGERMLAADVACIDSGTFYPAQALTGALFNMNGDDALTDLYRSLKVSS